MAEVSIFSAISTDTPLTSSDCSSAWGTRPWAAFIAADLKVIFLGDFIDGGKQNRRVLAIVRPMIESGQAFGIMGNHEYNAICYHTRDPAILVAGSDLIPTSIANSMRLRWPSSRRRPGRTGRHGGPSHVMDDRFLADSARKGRPE